MSGLLALRVILVRLDARLRRCALGASREAGASALSPLRGLAAAATAGGRRCRRLCGSDHGGGVCWLLGSAGAGASGAGVAGERVGAWKKG